MATGCFSFAFKRIPSFLQGGSADPESDDDSKLSGLFRSKSELNVKKTRRNSFWSKPSLSEADVCRLAPAGTRRYRRVLRDVESAGESAHDSNAHVVHRFSKEHLEKLNIDKTTDHSVNEDKTLPSETSDQRTSKKHPSEDHERPTLSKLTISFENEVEVIEYDRLEEVQTKHLYTHKVQLATGEEVTNAEEDDEQSSPQKENDWSLFLMAFPP